MPTAPLDERLVEAALALLELEGIAGLSMRAVARRAGVSHGAPLRHFSSFGDLRSEVAARGFRLLSDALASSAEALPPGAGALARLRAAGRAYVEVALANEALFTLMFQPHELEPGNESFAKEADAAFGQLASRVRAAQDAGWHAERDTRVLAGSVWAAVHGLATLWAQGALPGATGRDSLEDALTTTLELVLSDPPTPTPQPRRGERV